MCKDKITVVKVGGKIVEEQDSLDRLLRDFAAIDGFKLLVHVEVAPPQKLQPTWASPPL